MLTPHVVRSICSPLYVIQTVAEKSLVISVKPLLNGHLPIMATIFYTGEPPYNGHLFVMDTFLCPQGGPCGEAHCNLLTKETVRIPNLCITVKFSCRMKWRKACRQQFNRQQRIFLKMKTGKTKLINCMSGHRIYHLMT